MPRMEMKAAVKTNCPISCRKKSVNDSVKTCRVCGCSDNDCRKCIETTGEPCYWVEEDLCSACAGFPPPSLVLNGGEEA